MQLQLRKVAHEGGVNRIRAMTQNPHICASWADTGHVQVRFVFIYFLGHIIFIAGNQFTSYINFSLLTDKYDNCLIGFVARRIWFLMIKANKSNSVSFCIFSIQ